MSFKHSIRIFESRFATLKKEAKYEQEKSATIKTIFLDEKDQF